MGHLRLHSRSDPASTAFVGAKETRDWIDASVCHGHPSAKNRRAWEGKVAAGSARVKDAPVFQGSQDFRKYNFFYPASVIKLDLVKLIY